MSAANSSGVLPTGSAPCASNCTRVSGLCTTWRATRLSCITTGWACSPRKQSEPAHGLEARDACLADRRHVRQLRRTPGAADPEHAHAPGRMCCMTGAMELNSCSCAGQHVGHRLRRALVRHMRDLDPRHALEELHREMVRGAVARGCIVQLSGLPWRARSLLHRFRGTEGCVMSRNGPPR